MLKGLPASGKSTYAKELVAKGWKRINKDDLRAMIDGGKWSNQREKMIRNSESTLAGLYLKMGCSVIIDSTNFIYEDWWKNFAKEHNAEFETIFFDTPVMECIERDSKRGDKAVGAKVIMGMYNTYLKPKDQFSPFDSSIMPCYIFDIDGTIAEMNDRSPYEWDKVDTDNIKINIASIFDSLKKSGAKMFFLSGRDGSCYEKTLQWLSDHNLQHDGLFMRQAGDTRKDSIVKKELYEENIKGKYNVISVFDDRNQVVDLWRSLGLTCCQVDYGFF